MEAALSEPLSRWRAGRVPEVKIPPGWPKTAAVPNRELRCPPWACSFAEVISVFSYRVRPGDNFFLPLLKGWFCNPLLVASVVCGVFRVFLSNFDPERMTGKNEVVGDGRVFCFACLFCY